MQVGYRRQNSLFSSDLVVHSVSKPCKRFYSFVPDTPYCETRIDVMELNTNWNSGVI